MCLDLCCLLFVVCCVLFVVRYLSFLLVVCCSYCVCLLSDVYVLFNVIS